MKRAGLGFVAVAAAAWVLAAPAYAGIFDDDEARKAILDVRTKVEQADQGAKAREAELAEQINQLRRSLLDLNGTIEQLRADLARQRGIDEQLQRKIEPQKVTLDGKEFLADPDETRLYGEAVNVLRQGDFNGAVGAFTAFQKRYPTSGYGTASTYWLANAYYGKRDYKEAIPAFRALVSNAPDHPRAPEALLSIANCQLELKDPKAARRTLDELLKTYPKSEAAQAGRERIASLK
jgi:tol-pal system protein YbgF